MTPTEACENAGMLVQGTEVHLNHESYSFYYEGVVEGPIVVVACGCFCCAQNGHGIGYNEWVEPVAVAG